jgi:hypothetical protein
MALAGSIARTATLAHASPELIAVIRDSALGRVRHLVTEGTQLLLTQDYGALADTEQTLFAAQVGAGITDLLMNSLGYCWRDNAASLSAKLKPHADFIYGGGAATDYGVVLAEARGSFSPNGTTVKTASQAKGKYLRQVKPNLTKMSAHGRTIHGYSVALASPFGRSSTFLHVAETLIKGRHPAPPAVPIAGSTPRPQAIPLSLALSSHRSNFALLSAPRVSRWIDWVRFGGDAPDDGEPVRFVRFNYDRRTFLTTPSLRWRDQVPPHWIIDDWEDEYWWRWRARSSPRDRYFGEHAEIFAIEEKAAEACLNILSRIIRNPDERALGVELPTTQQIGFTTDETDRAETSREEYVYSLYRDGLALIGTPPRGRTLELRRWLPREGMAAG